MSVHIKTVQNRLANESFENQFLHGHNLSVKVPGIYMYEYEDLCQHQNWQKFMQLLLSHGHNTIHTAWVWKTLQAIFIHLKGILVQIGDNNIYTIWLCFLSKDHVNGEQP